ncbi:aspartic endopeptidase [Sporobolomyces koalae]|uniref:aspartic endopeptidase n=1 Tax=Sporobolomyces koalae TaxID=500713 RepID=UPI00317EC5D9
MTSEGLYRSYGALLLGALVPIYTASHASIRVPKSVKKLWKQGGDKQRDAKSGSDEAEDEDEEEEENEVDRLTAEDAYLFPILGSCVLFGLFLAFRYLDKALLNKILGGYLAIMGTGALVKALGDLGKSVIGERRLQKFDKYRLRLDKNTEAQFKFSFTKLHVFAGIGAAVLTVSQQYTQHWVLSNTLALAFAYSAISVFYVDSFLTGSILLGGLFFYDVWWVFGSKAVFGQQADVMVSVAKNFDAPIKIVFPKDLANAKDFTLLGLGDIVLPGSFLALALRFDYHLAIKRAVAHSQNPPRPSRSFPKPYFRATFLAYVLGLATTIFVMHRFQAAQPALLYLSPACVGSVALVSLIRGESAEVWKWEDGDEERKAREEKEKKEGKEGKEKEKEKEKTAKDDSADQERIKDEGRSVEGPTVETTSVEVDGGRVLRSRASKVL